MNFGSESLKLSIWVKVVSLILKQGGVSQFWQGLHRVKHLFKWGATFRVSNGKHCKFWEDCWAKEVPLCISHENLYRMTRDPHCSVSDCWEDGEWDMDFRRALSVQEYNEWLELINSLYDHKPEAKGLTLRCGL